jgi:hypothetical protein
MAQYLQLQIPSSCGESWHGMALQQAGRYCLSCKKTVVDFTAMSDSELAAYFKAHKGTTCGRFIQQQLNRDIPLPQRTLPWVKHFFLFLLTCFSALPKSGCASS